jgi:hypothetical protein
MNTIVMTVEIDPAGGMTLRVGELIWLYMPGECWLALVGYGVLWRVPVGKA